MDEKKRVPFSTVFKAFWRQYRINAIQSLSIGGTSGVILVALCHSAGLAIEMSIGWAFALLFLHLLPWIIDFFIFYRNYFRIPYIQGIDELFRKLSLIRKSGNKLLYRASALRAKSESTLVNKFLGTDVTIEALHSLEYIRTICKRILRYVLEEGDYYFTISNLNFWSQKPIAYYTLEQLIDANIEAAESGKKNVHRLIVVPKKMLVDSLQGEELEMQNDLKKLVDCMKKKLGRHIDNLSTHFYFIDDNDCKESEFLTEVAINPLALVITNDLKDIMLIVTDNLDKIDSSRNRSETPDLRLIFHDFPDKRDSNKIVSPRHVGVLTNVRERATDASFMQNGGREIKLKPILKFFEMEFNKSTKGELRKYKTVNELYEHFFSVPEDLDGE